MRNFSNAEFIELVNLNQFFGIFLKYSFQSGFSYKGNIRFYSNFYKDAELNKNPPNLR